jgi:cytochrome c oxidase cbb3-type subunit I/II
MKHRMLEGKATVFSVLVVVLMSIGGIAEIVPVSAVKANIPEIASVKPYSPLELEGRDIYIREGCYNCHSQMIRPFRAETLRYGEYSRAGEFVYDHPFQWGSKRTGPDLAREGVTRPDPAWHWKHFDDPRQMSEGSIMPRYGWLLRDKLDTSLTQKKMEAMKTLGVPYSAEDIAAGPAKLQEQAGAIQASLKEKGIEAGADVEAVALIAYLKRLGTDFMSDKNNLTVPQ